MKDLTTQEKEMIREEIKAIKEKREDLERHLKAFEWDVPNDYRIDI